MNFKNYLSKYKIVLTFGGYMVMSDDIDEVVKHIDWKYIDKSINESYNDKLIKFVKVIESIKIPKNIPFFSIKTIIISVVSKLIISHKFKINIDINSGEFTIDIGIDDHHIIIIKKYNNN